MPDPSATVNALVGQQFSTLQTSLTGTIVPALFGLIIVGIVVALGIKYTKRGAQKA